MRRALLALLCASAAAAYVPSVNSLLHRSAERVSEGSRTREATLTGALSIGGGKPEPRTLVLRFPLQCRFANGAQVRGTSASPFGRGEGGSGPERDLLELACPFLAYRGVSMAEAERILRVAAADAGVDLNAATAIDRLGDRVTVVVGDALRAELPGGHTIGQDTDIRATAGRDAPGTAELRASSTAEVRLATGEAVLVRAELLLTEQTGAATGAVSVDGVTVAVRNWTFGLPETGSGDERGQQQRTGAGAEQDVVAGDPGAVATR